MRLYIAGPMRGYPKYNSDAFVSGAKLLRTAGYDVISPIELDTQDGMDFTSTETVEATVKRNSQGLPDEEYYLERDFKVLRECQGIALLNGWEDSVGTKREIFFAIKHGLLIKPIQDWLV